MTDPRSARPEGPSDDAAEGRLRCTLATVADRDPVTPQLDDLRARLAVGPATGGGSPIDATDVRPSRRRAVGAAIAAAALAVVVAGAVVTTRDDGTETTGMVATPPSGTGWYLPTSGTGWEVVDVVGVPWAQRLSSRREVAFSTPDRSAGLMVEEYERAAGDRDPVASLEPVERGSGPTSRTYGVWLDVDGESPELVVARRGDRVLGVNVRDVDAETVFEVVDGWWESDGQRIDPVPGMVRTSDVSSDRGREGHTRVIVTVRRPADGVQVSYALTPSGVSLLPTGIDDDDLGAARGLEEDVRPRPLEGVPDQPGPAWEVGPDSAPGSTSVVSLAPGADIVIADDLSFAPPPPGAAPGASIDPTEQVIRRRAHIELLGALRLTSAQAWADAVALVDADPQLAAPTIADVPTGDIGPGTTTTVLAGTPDATAPTSVPPTSESLDPEAVEVAEALIAFARDPNDETFAAVRFNDRVSLVADSGMLADRASLRDPDAWRVPLRNGTLSALDRLADAGALEVVPQDVALLDCGDPVYPSPGPHMVAIVPVDPASCAEDFAVLVNGDGGRISEVSLVLPSP